MANEQLQELLAAASADESIAARFAGVVTAEEAVAVAAELGYAISAEDITELASGSDELSDAELAEVAGGVRPPVTTPCSFGCTAPTRCCHN